MDIPHYYQLPKIMELVGLGYTGWFVYRYLLFKVTNSRKLQRVDDYIRHFKLCRSALLDLYEFVSKFCGRSFSKSLRSHLLSHLSLLTKHFFSSVEQEGTGYRYRGNKEEDYWNRVEPPYARDLANELILYVMFMPKIFCARGVRLP